MPWRHFFILVQRDIKRLLAYSSVENMGLVAVALGIGGPLGNFCRAAAHLKPQSGKKRCCSAVPAMYCSSTARAISTSSAGCSKSCHLPPCCLAAVRWRWPGCRPSTFFLSEFMTVTAGLARNHLLIIVMLLLLLTLVLAGLVRMAARVLMAKPPQAVNRGDLGWLTTSPMVILLVMMLAMGTHIPQPVIRIPAGASTIVLSGDARPACTT
ncbi:hypothetical protein KZ770_11715 [Escherichia coli]|nr:hypothetical protein [Escherichia coli]